MPPSKSLYLMAGPNGAGKTTASFVLLPEFLGIREFVNADEIARGLSPFNPESVALEAGRIMLRRMDFLLKSSVSFALETTLATRSYKSFIQKAQAQGYHCTLLFFALPSAEMAINRVKQRVTEGGHNIPADVIERRYERGLKNLFDYYWDVVDELTLFESIDEAPSLIGFKKGADLTLYDPELYEHSKQLPAVEDAHLALILTGVQEAYRRMVEEKRRKGELMVIMDKYGKIMKVKP